ncbi:hypothetical protein [Amycolatopsis kentuckyensis]|uniref:hypothetical protein n=1 Tax=Amycolatopsis kentuckyensis TaxID=218823 RepID=UPI000A3A0C55|nr:hypothetical protein [Amycolatopsis kentuckyensis]
MPGSPFPRRLPSFDLAELVGRTTEDARQRCERDGFHVQVIDLDKTAAVTLEYHSNRIRLGVRRGVVEDCHQG